MASTADRHSSASITTIRLNRPAALPSAIQAPALTLRPQRSLLRLLTKLRTPLPLSDRGPTLHDGRTADVLQAIETHADCNGKIPDGNHDRFHPSKCSSEANGVINNFNALSPSQQQDILNFLRSL